jgi:hypothetical protein
VRCFLEPPSLAFPAGLFRDITQSIVCVIGSVTLCGTFTSRETGYLWRCDDLFLAMDKPAVEMFAAPIEATLKNFVEFGDTGVACHEQTPPRVKFPRQNAIAWSDERSDTQLSIFPSTMLRAVLNGVSPLVWRRFLSRPVVVDGNGVVCRYQCTNGTGRRILEQAGRLLATQLHAPRFRNDFTH